MTRARFLAPTAPCHLQDAARMDFAEKSYAQQKRIAEQRAKIITMQQAHAEEVRSRARVPFL